MNERLFIGAIHVQNRNIIFDIMFLSLLSYVLTFLFNMYCLLFTVISSTIIEVIFDLI